MRTSLRSHTCGELTKENIGAEIALCGWVQTRRDHGGIIFVDLRDRYGLTQVVFDPKNNSTNTPDNSDNNTTTNNNNNNTESKKSPHKIAERIGREWVLRCKGIVRARKEGMTNPKMHTGEIEVLVSELEILNKCEMLPFEIEDNSNVNEDLRLKYRYLDLRRPTMQKNLMIRHKAMHAARQYLTSQNFREVATPMFVKPTPEGARDFLVPSRVHPGKFYALPQSPQLYKQLLMVGGVDRYFQVAFCLRDEDGRADRQPEHQQIDLEMSFVTPEDVFKLVEGTMKAIWKESIDYDVKTPFVRIDYEDALNRFGSDKPDLRFGMEMVTVTDVFKNSGFSVVENAINNGGIVKGLRVPTDLSRKEQDKLLKVAYTYHAKGMLPLKVRNNKLEGSFVKFLDENKQSELMKVMNAKNGDTLLFVADKFKTACTALGQIRLILGEKLNLIKKNEFIFCWVVNFPLFEWNDETERWDPAHHPFCMPKQEHIKYLDDSKDFGKVYCNQYDLAVNGVELCSGSLRINVPEIQEKVFKAINIPYAQAQKKFGFLLDAFKFGAPPHAGVGLGLDRIVGLLCNTTDIKEVIAFPKNKKLECPMDGSPSLAEDEQLKELHLKLEIVKKPKEIQEKEEEK